MLMIRLQRVGRKNEAMFRFVVTEKHKGPKSGRVVELLGSYSPKLNEINVKADRATYWLSVGAQASDTVHNLLLKKGIIKGKTINVLPKKTPIIKEGEATEATAPVAEETPTPAVEEAPEEAEAPTEVAPESAEESAPTEADVKAE